jgi:hypothetical protein
MPEDAARGGAIASLNTESIPESDAEAPSAHSRPRPAAASQSPIDPQMETSVMTLKVLDDVYDVGKLQVTGKAMAERGRAAPHEPEPRVERRLRQGEVPRLRRGRQVRHRPPAAPRHADGQEQDVRLVPGLRL